MPRALDLFCGAGGAAHGLRLAGFHVTGIDNRPQPSYAGDEFILADALTPPVPLSRFDLIWASPPCQRYTTLKVMWNAKEHPDLIAPVREMLARGGVPWVIENVPGAPLLNPVKLCGSMFDLGVEVYQLRRHRLFECSFPVEQPRCHHNGATIGVYGDHARDRRRKPGVRDRGIDFPDKDKLRLGREAMGMPWAEKWKDLSQAIPPAYAEYIGRRVTSSPSLRPG